MNNLKEILAQKKIKQNNLAKKLGVSKEAVNYWVKNKTNPSPKNLRSLSLLLNVSIDEIFFGLKNSSSDNVNNNKPECQKTPKICP
jgi:transcriptional regulator with XRE-family HTH domain